MHLIVKLVGYNALCFSLDVSNVSCFLSSSSSRAQVLASGRTFASSMPLPLEVLSV